MYEASLSCSLSRNKYIPKLSEENENSLLPEHTGIMDSGGTHLYISRSAPPPYSSLIGKLLGYAKKMNRKNYQNENKNQKLHKHRVRKKVLVRELFSNTYEEPYKCYFPINHIWTNGSVTIGWGAITERIKIKWIKPCNE